MIEIHTCEIQCDTYCLDLSSSCVVCYLLHRLLMHPFHFHLFIFLPKPACLYSTPFLHVISSQKKKTQERK